MNKICDICSGAFKWENNKRERIYIYKAAKLSWEMFN